MCYQSGMVSCATDTVGHAVGVLGVGLLDTDCMDMVGRPELVAVVAAGM